MTEQLVVAEVTAEYYRRRYRLYEKVVESWGREAADTLMSLLPHRPYVDVNEEVAALRRRVAELENELVARPPAAVGPLPP